MSTSTRSAALAYWLALGLVLAGGAMMLTEPTEPPWVSGPPPVSGTPHEADVVEPSGPLVVDYGPCLGLHEQPDGGGIVCEVDPTRSLRLWLDLVQVSQVEDIRVFVDGRRAPVTPITDEHIPGLGVKVTLFEGAREVQVDASSRSKPWRLSVQTCTHCHPVSPPALDAALEGFEERLWQDELPKDLERQVHRFDDTLEQHGLVEERIGVHIASAHRLAREHRFDDAQALLDRVASLARRAPRLQALLDYARGSLDWRWGRAGQALVEYRRASLHGVRVDESVIAMAALPMYADLLAAHGYVDAAVHWSRIGLDRARKRGSPCDVASTLRTVGWAQLLLRQQRLPTLHPWPLLEESLASFESSDCSEGRAGGAQMTLGRLALQDDEPRLALELATAALEDALTPGERVEALDVKIAALSSLGRRPATIEGGLRQMTEAVERAGTLEARWMLALRRGRVHEQRAALAGRASGRDAELTEALAQYRQAEAWLDDLAALAGIGVGRQAAGLLHRESSERLVEVLRGLGRLDDALCVARQAEARRLQTARLSSLLRPSELEVLEHRRRILVIEQERLDALQTTLRDAPGSRREAARVAVGEQQRRLQHAIDEILALLGQRVGRPPCEALHLPEPDERELLLGLFRSGDQWLLVAKDANQTIARKVSLEELDVQRARSSLSELLLGPIAERLADARRVRVHAVEPALEIDFEQLLVPEGILGGEQPLMAHRSVVYGIDVVGDRDGAPSQEPTPKAAVLLTDPTGSLSEATDEIERASAVLTSMGWDVDVIERGEARAHEVLSRIDGASLFHFAGHSEHVDPSKAQWWPPHEGGSPGWPASLRLADGDRLAATQLLADERGVASRVILSGCESGALDTSLTGTSLALAFLVAGAREVLATTDAIPDARARRIIDAVYDEMQASTSEAWSLAEAHAGAWRRLHERDSRWSYRVWVR